MSRFGRRAIGDVQRVLRDREGHADRKRPGVAFVAARADVRQLEASVKPPAAGRSVRLPHDLIEAFGAAVQRVAGRY